MINEPESRRDYQPEYAGYHCTPICRLMHGRNIKAVTGYRRRTHRGERFGKRRFKYDRDVYVCPRKHELRHTAANQTGFREYANSGGTC